MSLLCCPSPRGVGGAAPGGVCAGCCAGVIQLRGLRMSAVVGVLPSERATPQPLEADVSLELCLCAAGAADSLDGGPAGEGASVDYAALAAALAAHAAAARALTIEALASQLAHRCLRAGAGVRAATVLLAKPQALPHLCTAPAVSVRACRCRELQRGGAGAVAPTPAHVVAGASSAAAASTAAAWTAAAAAAASDAASDAMRATLAAGALASDAVVAAVAAVQQATQQASEAVLQVKVAVTAANAAATTSASISSSTGGAQAAAGSTPVAADESEPLSFFLALPLELEPFISRVHLALGSNLGDRVENIERALALLEVGLEAEEAAAKAAGEAAAAAEAEDGFELPAAAPCARPLALPAGAYLRVSDTSFLYETPPAYVLDQPAFVNAAAAVETNLSPLALLAHIKANIEAALGRPLLGAGAGAAPRFGPRVIDVDIVLWGARVLRLANGALQVPHQRLAERDFVLGPLADVAPEATHPTLHASVAALLHACTRNSSGGGGPSLRRVLPMPFRAWSGGAARATALVPLGARTLVMGVLNVTPDSFSDGGALEAGGVSAALEAAQRLVAAGADIVDIGGQSTRPGAAPVSAAAEAARVLPVIAALRSWLDATPAAAHVAISVDTFSARVAAAALRAGATMLNDVAAGGLDARMLRTAARARVPYVAMHMRGTPATMRGLAVYAGARGAAARAAGEVAQRAFAAGSGGGGSGGGEPAPAPGPAATEAAADAAAEATAAVVEVRTVLAARAAAAIAAGVRRWHFCVDPGLGFAKTTAHNLALLRAPGLAAALPFPSVYGPSRKAFIGELTGRARPADRVAGTCAAVSAAVAVGADIVRVHDVAEAADAAKVADAVWRAQA